LERLPPIVKNTVKKAAAKKPAAKKTVKKAAVKKTVLKKPAKYVYSFGAGKAEGNGKMKELLGGKGANLAEMAGQLKLPVPPGLPLPPKSATITGTTNAPIPKP
jgi:pyruvate,orthophosphate dikinase